MRAIYKNVTKELRELITIAEINGRTIERIEVTCAEANELSAYLRGTSQKVDLAVYRAPLDYGTFVGEFLGKAVNIEPKP